MQLLFALSLLQRVVKGGVPESARTAMREGVDLDRYGESDGKALERIGIGQAGDISSGDNATGYGGDAKDAKLGDSGVGILKWVDWDGFGYPGPVNQAKNSEERTKADEV